MSRSEQIFSRLRKRAVEEEERKIFEKYGDDPQDAVPEGAAPVPVIQELHAALAPPLAMEDVWNLVRAFIKVASAEQLTVMISLIFTQIRESGYTLSAPMESVLNGAPPAWRILDADRRQVGAVRWVDGEWTTEADGR